MTDAMTPEQAARIALACLDLTSLNEPDTEADIAALCQRAQSRFGPVAAVCVWPRLARFARAQLPASIAVAAVANFPGGSNDVEAALRDVGQIVEAGAQEVDLVLPYVELMRGGAANCSLLLQAARGACKGLALKVILETGALVREDLIVQATRIALDAGADFVKTSTGKIKLGATPAAAAAMLATIAAEPGSRAGFKVSGGVRSMADAQTYIDLVARHLGPQALTCARFRIGASSLLADIEARLGGAAAPAPERGAY